jgi:calcineurin-like phosphoesterase family protein
VTENGSVGAPGEGVQRSAWSFEEWKSGTVYYTADWHLGHERIIDLCDRPFGSVAEMNDAIITGVNEEMRPVDTLVILGDLAMGKLEETLKLLRAIKAARIWVIPGNHDRWSLAYGHRGAKETLRIKRGLWRVQYEAAHRHLRAEPDLVPSAWSTRVGGRRVLLSHYPYVGDSQTEDRYRPLRPRDTGLPLLHGHVHGRWRVGRVDGETRMLNVGVDVWNYRPVPEWLVADWLVSIHAPGAAAGIESWSPEDARIAQGALRD